jgi:alkylation response protein AidB-like acyl-CoA dehydrogenase
MPAWQGRVGLAGREPEGGPLAVPGGVAGCGTEIRCVQLHGGYGYMREYPVARSFADSRVQTIFGGTTEIMKEIIGRGLGV